MRLQINTTLMFFNAQKRTADYVVQVCLVRTTARERHKKSNQTVIRISEKTKEQYFKKKEEITFTIHIY